MSSVDGTGYHLTSQAERLSDLIASFQAIYGEGIDVSPSSPDGKWLGVLAGLLFQTDQRLQTIYNARSPSGATGAALARLALLTGTAKKPAQFSTAPVVLTGTPGAAIPGGSLVTSDGTDGNAPATWQTLDDYVIGTGGTVNGQVAATTAGPVLALSGHINQIQTVISGWTGVTSTTDAAPGTLIEQDAQLRVRRAASVALASRGLVDSMSAGLGQVADVTSVSVVENFGETVDDNGLPPHSANAIVAGFPDPASIAQVIWRTKAPGCALVGAQTYNYVDQQGQTRLIRWDWATQTPAYVTVVLGDAVGSDVQQQIINNLVGWGNGTLLDAFGNQVSAGSQVGKNVIWSQLFVPLNLIAGLNITSVFLGSAPDPTAEANLSIHFNAIAAWDPSRIIVTGP